MPKSTASNPAPPSGASHDAVGQSALHRSNHCRSRRSYSLRMHLNLTAMLDVIFLLLIYFVITANFVLDEGVLTARMPRGTGEVPAEHLTPPVQPLEIILTPVDDYRVNVNVAGTERITTFTQLAYVLTRLQHDPQRGLTGVYPPDSPVIIRPGAEVRWQHVVEAFNASVKARYFNVAFTEWR